MSTLSRRDLLTRSLPAAAALGAAAPLILTSRKSVVRASSFPPFNQSAISPTTINNFTSIFLEMANDMYHYGTTSGTKLSTAHSIWGSLYTQLASSGFNSAAVQYINAGLPNADPQVDPLYNLLTPHGLQQGWGYFYNYIYGKLNAKFTSNVNPAVYYYGVESTNYGHACSLAHFAGVLGTATAAPAAPPATSGTYLILPPPPKPSQPGAYEDFCWYLGGFFAYMGIMAIPLGTAGAAFPPLGVGLGMALAFAAPFAWGFCG